MIDRAPIDRTLIDDRPRTPPRRPGSVRRTTTVTIRQPGGITGPIVLLGRGRDLATPLTGDPVEIAFDTMAAEVERPYRLTALETSPDWPEVQALVGDHAIKGYRGRLAAALAGRSDHDRPLGTLLDDIAASSLIAGWALTLPPGSAVAAIRADPARRRRMAGTCTGYGPDSEALNDDFIPGEPVCVGPVGLAHDPIGWHAFAPSQPYEMRRARRIDVWREDDCWVVDAMFQDSALVGDGTRRAVHDYGMTARFDMGSADLVEIVAQPRILPHDVCPNAATGLHVVTGTPAALLRSSVLGALRGVAGCTHLNDAIRALAAVPWLGAQLPA